MEKYMGFRSGEGKENPARELPKTDLAGTLFYIDIKNQEFREVDNPYNRITLGGVSEEKEFTYFLYDPETKNRYTGDPDNIPYRVRIVLVPPLKNLDPVGLAERQGVPLNPEWKPKEKLTAIPANHMRRRKRGRHL